MSGRVARVRYKEDKPGRTAPEPGSTMLPFGAFCISPRVQGLTNKIARDVAITARLFSPNGEGTGPHYRDQFITTPGPPVVIARLPRATSLVGNTAPQAAAVEFGSGEPSVGDSAGVGRPQGGYNYAFRPLGKAGRIYGDFHE